MAFIHVFTSKDCILSSSQQKVMEIIRNLRYDFANFNLKDFIRYISAQRGRRIYIRRLPLDPELFGAWLPTPSADYIFVNSTVHPIHQLHCVLHEMAHILLNHPRRKLDQILPPELFQVLKMEMNEGCARYAPALHVNQTPEEREAEDFVFQIQDQVIQANRLQELTATGSSIESLLPLIDTSES